MKTEFYINCHERVNQGGSMIQIIGKAPDKKPYISFKIGQRDPFGYLEGKELEQLAINILSAIKSKRLKPAKKKKRTSTHWTND